MLYQYENKRPVLAENVYIAEGAKIIGDVQIGEESSIWYNTVIRGDLTSIKIGKGVNIQDLSVVHVKKDQPVVIEDHVTVGHTAIIHGCTIKKGCLIGMGSTILDGAIIDEESLVAAGSLVTPNKTFPPRVLIMGSPAKVVRELTEEELLNLRRIAENYVEKVYEYKNKVVPIPLP